MVCRRYVLALILLAPAMAGCLADDEGTDEADAEYWSMAEQETFEPFFHTVVTREGPVDVAGYFWGMDRSSDAVVLAVTGVSGGTHVTWGPFSTAPGYSVAHRFLDSGVSFVAIDLPAYGNSSSQGTASVDLWMEVIDDVAGTLRSGGIGPGYERVFGLGWSMGSILLSSTQGTYHSFDGLATTGWSPDGFSQEGADCIQDASTCPPSEEVVFFQPNADAAVVQEFLAGTGDVPTGAYVLVVMMGCVGCLAPGGPVPEPTVFQALAGQIEAPVLEIIGEHDFYYPSDDAANDGDYYASDDVEIMVLEDTGHDNLHHLNHAEVAQHIVAWVLLHSGSS